MSEIEEKELREKVVKVMRIVEKVILTPEGNFENVDIEELQSIHADMNFLVNSLNRYMNMLENIIHFKELWESFKSKGNFESAFKIYLTKIHGTNMPGGEDSIPF
jgi:hypothetical protein